MCMCVCIHGMMGMFHWTKILLKCASRYLRGSGLEDALIEEEVFGKLTLNGVLEGTHYVRSFHGIMMISDLISSLSWEACWSWLGDTDTPELKETLDTARCVQQSFLSKKTCPDDFTRLCVKISNLESYFERFLSECSEKSEIYEYLQIFQ